MPARSTPQEARARIPAVFTVPLDRLIPEDEEARRKGGTFADFGDQVETMGQVALPVALKV